MSGTMLDTLKYGEEEAAEKKHDDIITIIEEEEQRAKDELSKKQEASGGDHDGEEPLMALLQQASVEGVDLRGALAGRFARDDAGAKIDEYKTTGRAEKAEFRRQWAATRLSELTQMREREEEWKQVDTTKGNMVSIKAFVRREGADAKKYIQKCAALGPPGSTMTRCGRGTNAW